MSNNNNNLNNNGSPGTTDIMFQMEDEGLTQLGSVFQSAYQSIVGGGPQVNQLYTLRHRRFNFYHRRPTLVRMVSRWCLGGRVREKGDLKPPAAFFFIFLKLVSLFFILFFSCFFFVLKLSTFRFPSNPRYTQLLNDLRFGLTPLRRRNKSVIRCVSQIVNKLSTGLIYPHSFFFFYSSFFVFCYLIFSSSLLLYDITVYK